MADQWEYKKVEDDINEYELNQLGADGWELAGTLATSTPRFTNAVGVAVGDGTVTHVAFIFKRRKE